MLLDDLDARLGISGSLRLDDEQQRNNDFIPTTTWIFGVAILLSMFFVLREMITFAYLRYLDRRNFIADHQVFTPRP